MAEKTKKPANPAAIQTVKAIATLVIICLVCVALLALLNDLLYVAPPAADDVYKELHVHEDGSTFERDTDFNTTLNSEYKKNTGYGEIISVARCKVCKAFIFEAISSNKGYQNGTVTLYVVVNSEAKIEKWSIKEASASQTFINKIPANAGNEWYVGQDVTAEIAFGDGTGMGAGTGATRSSEAINAAINMVAYYCCRALNVELGLGEIKDPLKEAQDAANEVIAGTEFASYSLTRYTAFASIKVDGTTSYASAVSDSDYTLTYMFRGTGSNGVLFVYVFSSEEDIKVIAVSEGELVAKSDNVEDTDEIYTNVMKYPFYNVSAGGSTILTVVSGQTQSGSTLYTVVSISPGYDPGNYTLYITIETDGGFGKVTSVELVGGRGGVGDGWLDGYEEEASHDKASIMITELVGATSANIDTVFNGQYGGGSGPIAGATQSAKLITAAVKAALADYDAKLQN